MDLPLLINIRLTPDLNQLRVLDKSGESPQKICDDSGHVTQHSLEAEPYLAMFSADARADDTIGLLSHVLRNPIISNVTCMPRLEGIIGRGRFAH